MGKVLVAFAEADAEIGAGIADALAAEGMDVSATSGMPGSKMDKDRFDAASRVVLIWSRKAVGDAILRREGALAATRGKLALVRLDGLPQPPSLRTPVSFALPRARGQAGAHQFARLLARSAAPSPVKPAAALASPIKATGRGVAHGAWKGTLALVALFLVSTYGVLYAVNGKEPTGVVRAFVQDLTRK